MTSTDDIAVRLVSAEEASLLIALIRRCYGETYIDPAFYDPAAVAGLLASGQLHSIGAFTAENRLVGHMGITLRAHAGITADAGMTLVDPAFRGRGIARRVALGLARQSTVLGLVGVHDYPVTVHAATQRLGDGFVFYTGLMLANMPSDVAFREMETPSSGARTSSLIRWLPFGLPPVRRVHLPERYRERIEAMYAEANLPRTLMGSEDGLGARESELERVYDERRQILRLAVARAGADLAIEAEAARREATVRGGLLAHVDLPLADPATPSATEALRGIGFSFAGLLPEYRDGDVLRMQWLTDSLDGDAAGVLSTDATRALHAFVQADRGGSSTIRDSTSRRPS